MVDIADPAAHPNFVAGMSLAVLGFLLNVRADKILRRIHCQDANRLVEEGILEGPNFEIITVSKDSETGVYSIVESESKETGFKGEESFAPGSFSSRGGRLTTPARGKKSKSRTSFGVSSEEADLKKMFEEEEVAPTRGRSTEPTRLSGSTMKDLTSARGRTGRLERIVVPRGGMFDYVCAANFTYEIMEWFGFALATNFAIPQLAFFLYTTCNLCSRGLRHRQWYQKRMGKKYLKGRTSVIPYIF